MYLHIFQIQSDVHYPFWNCRHTTVVLQGSNSKQQKCMNPYQLCVSMLAHLWNEVILDFCLPSSHAETEQTSSEKDKDGRGKKVRNMHAVTTFLMLGCWLGDAMSNIREAKKVWVPGAMQDRVKIAEGLSSTPSKLAINLMNALFTSEQMASGNCTPSTTYDILDQKRIEGIRCKLLSSYAH